MAAKLERCGKRFAYGRRCARLAGHRGNHATRLSIGEMSRLSGLRIANGRTQE